MLELVLPEDFDDYAWEVEAKGYLLTASIRFGERRIPVAFYDPVRLAQDIETELEAGRVAVFMRVIVVRSLTAEAMRDSVERLDPSVLSRF